MRRILLGAVWVVGCGGDLSNTIFEEDAEFMAALPSAESLQAVYLEDRDVSAEGTDFYTLTVASLGTANQYVEMTTGLSAIVSAVPPTERGPDHRVWGPGEWDDLPGYFVRIEISRNPEATRYSYGVQLARSSGGPWDTEFFSGTHYVHETVEQGNGTLTWDFEALYEIVGVPGDGEITIDYDLWEGTQIAVDVDGVFLEGEGPYTARWFFTRGEDGGGDFEYETLMDIDSDAVLEDVAIRSRWTPEGDGRGDAGVAGGSLGVGTATIFQCWGAEGELTAQGSSVPEYVEDIGDPEVDCPFAEAASLERL